MSPFGGISNLEKVIIRPAWIPIEDGLHPFQDRMADLKNWESDTLVVDAPTGSGKTYGFIELCKRNVKGKKDGRLLIVEPTRKLCRQVYQDFNEEGFDPEIIDAESIKNEQKQSEGNFQTIRRLFRRSRWDVVITNPVQLSMIAHNFYQGSKEDRIFSLRRNFPYVAIDEWHAYDQNQSAHILALHNLLTVTNDVKFLYASATPPLNCEEILSSAGIDVETEKVELMKDAERKSRKVRKIRGEVALNIYDKNCLNWVKQNIDELEEGRWILIFDKIKDLAEANELLSNRFPDETCPLSGFHRSTKEFPAPKDYEWEDRIVLCTNILELGTNPPSGGDKAYRNLVMDPGFSWKNTIQRFGRIGRNGLDANVFLCRKGVIELYPKRKIKKLVENKKIDYKNFQKWCIESQENMQLTPLNGERVGIQIGVIIDRFEDWKAKKSLGSKINDKKLKKGIDIVWKAKKGIEEFPQEDYRSTVEALSEWWEDYLSSLSYFIKPGEEKEIEFENIGKVFTAEYDSLWIKENMTSDGDTYRFRDEKSRDFFLRVKGIPFKKDQRVRFDEYKYDGRKLILDNFEASLNDAGGLGAMIGEEDHLKKLKKSLKPFLTYTASSNRLLIKEVMNDAENNLL